MKYLYLLVFMLVNNQLFSQQRGYKEIQIGITLSAINDLGTYKIYKSTASGVYYIEAPNMRICNMDIAKIRVDVDVNDIISRVDILTKSFRFDNYDSFFSNFQTNVGCLINTVGKASWTNVGNEKEGKKAIAWVFERENTELFMSTGDAGTFEKNFDRDYTFTWMAYTPNKMW